MIESEGGAPRLERAQETKPLGLVTAVGPKNANSQLAFTAKWPGEPGFAGEVLSPTVILLADFQPPCWIEPVTVKAAARPERAHGGIASDGIAMLPRVNFKGLVNARELRAGAGPTIPPRSAESPCLEVGKEALGCFEKASINGTLS